MKRVDRALKGADVDRPSLSFWRHFGLKMPESHAQATLAFHRVYRTGIVKAMSDLDYPKPAGKWHESKVDPNPFPHQIQALNPIRQGLRGDAYILETLFNPWNVAQKLSSKEEVPRLKDENPTALLAAFDVIAQPEIAHARRALRAGSGLNFLHVHVEPPYLGFLEGLPAPVFNYSLHVSGIPIAGVRQRFSTAIAGGIDEVNYQRLTADETRAQWKAVAQAAGPKYILTPGCSVPNDSTADELSRLPRVLGA
jgi:hypothetical protein